MCFLDIANVCVGYLYNIFFVVFPYYRLHTHNIKTASKQLTAFVNPRFIPGEESSRSYDAKNNNELNRGQNTQPLPKAS